MKTKLLRRIRKQYSIVYYPNTRWYEIKHPHVGLEVRMMQHVVTRSSLEDGGLYKSKTLQGAKDKLLKIVKHFYYKHTRKYKLSKISEKVWYNTKKQTPSF